MKIGLIGINRYANYLNFACNLHAYAFQQYLTNKDYDSTFIDCKPITFDGMDLREPAKFTEAKYRTAIAANASTPAAVKDRNTAARKWAELAMGYRALTEERKLRYDKFESFISQHLGFTEEEYGSDLLEIEDPGMDCHICVTDDIWQPWTPDYSFDRGFMLGSKAFEGKPKIAYAPSRGAKPGFEPELSNAFFEYLEDIESMSARERDFGQSIEENTGRTIPTVIDPVLLHGQDSWRKIAVPPNEQRYLLLYYVMERSTDTVAKAVEYAKANDLTIVELSDRPMRYGKVTDPGVKHVPRYDVSAEEWLGNISHADAVFTNSFPGCCFSLIFEKLFFVGKRNGNKAPNFLPEFDLTNQQFAPDDDVADFSKSIECSQAQARVLDFRSQSEEFLPTALQQAEESSDASSEVASRKHTARQREITYPALFPSGALANNNEVTSVSVTDSDSQALKVKKLRSGSIEYSTPWVGYTNTGLERIAPNKFQTPTHHLAGWTLRFRVDKRWFWYLSDKTLAERDTKASHLDPRKMVFEDGAPIPHLPVNAISAVVFVAKWRNIEPQQARQPVKGRIAKLKNRFASKQHRNLAVCNPLYSGRFD
ncbi:Polysaccharide pyruvyl transferase [Brevibacterium sp. 239c]|uniref:polysaccharide pyruvyl transferase family protein n=1 Tax=Brevibacterium sp. 239c TaxID=1965356 RepID=UPI000C46C7D5|nr:polysaccharide pyruvyl transferase family protein [Brevibacterium sp. 239c]SMY04277.1 Polysaccharide pyruvyl transferase [Brevibacterium sp. 239c]